MIGDIGWQELLIILVIVALLFGASRVADMGKALGRGVREFRDEARGAAIATRRSRPPPARRRATRRSVRPSGVRAPAPR